MGADAEIGLNARQASKDPAEQRIARLTQEQGLLLTEIERHPRKCAVTRNLLSAIMASDCNGCGRKSSDEIVQRRIAELQELSNDLLPAEQRDLLVVLFFGIKGRVSHDLRIKAFSVLHLGGSPENRRLVLEVFPGMRNVLEA